MGANGPRIGFCITAKSRLSRSHSYAVLSVMYHGPLPEIDRSLSWRSILIGYVIMIGVFVLMVAVSYPRLALGVIASGAGMYGLYRVARWAATLGVLRNHRPNIYWRRTYKPR